MIFKKFMENDQYPKDLFLLLLVGGLFTLSTALSNTFVNIFLWKQSGEITDIAFYNLAIVVMQPIAFNWAGWLAKKVDRVIVLRIGVFILALFYIGMLFMGTLASSYLLALGAILGFGLGFYWLAFNVLTLEVTEPETRDFFNGYLGVLNSFSGMLGPLSAGFIITRMDKQMGYETIFSISMILFLVAVVISFFLQRRKADGHYGLKEVFQERKVNHDWQQLLRAHLFQGLREGTFLFLIVIWVYTATKSEFALGTFGFVQSIVSFIGYYAVSHFLKPWQRKQAIFAGGLLLFISPIMLLFPISFSLLIIYGISVSVAYPLLLVPYVSITYDIIGKCRGIYEKRIEYIVVRELYLNIGRIISILTFIIVVSYFSEERGIPMLLPVLGAGHFFIYFCLKKVSVPSNPIDSAAESIEFAETQQDGNNSNKQ
ncbi:MFS transporter [Fictibacillus barbaricus]|uniref:YQGE family putative transporter n=1 Tax=Fictibacillus barbaricus TaxID=182136 RepID=A0ABU1TZV1_9BACL|nr:MFS transporter [Fictibacillus barbaricus]MDR7072752.1 YQGE family putative transporter [Fictibacillus barbaricus]